MIRLACFFLVGVSLVPNLSEAAVLAFSFSGVVSFNSPAAPSPFQIPAFSPVIGHFVYDTNAPIAHGAGASNNNSEYRDSFSQGLFATFGNVAVSADNYAVLVEDNVAQPTGPALDIIQVQFSSGLSPALGSGLLVNGTNQQTGLFSINLAADSSLLSNSSLPAGLSLSDYAVPTASFLSHTAAGPLDAIFTLTSLTVTPVPEPDTGVLIALGLAILVAYRLQRAQKCI